MTDLSELAKVGVGVATRWSGLPFVIRNTYARRKVAILAYHDPSPEVLDRHLRFLTPRYTFITLDRLVGALRSGDWSSLPSKSLVLTIDDGHKGNYRVRAAYQRYGVVPTIYLCSEIAGTLRHFWFLEAGASVETLKRLPDEDRLAWLAQERGFTPEREYPGDRHALTRREISEMTGSTRFGSHSRFHPILTRCGRQACEREVRVSRQEVAALSGSPCLDFSYPNGDYGIREVEAVRNAGYHSARTVDFGWNDARTDPFRLKIIGLIDYGSVDRLAADLAGVGYGLARLVRRRLGRRGASTAAPAPQA